jgi:hypothetical protein
MKNNPFAVAPIMGDRFQKNFKNTKESDEWGSIVLANEDADGNVADNEGLATTINNDSSSDESEGEEQEGDVDVNDEPMKHGYVDSGEVVQPNSDILSKKDNGGSSIIPLSFQATYHTTQGLSVEEHLSVISPSGWYPSLSARRLWCHLDERKSSLSFHFPHSPIMLDPSNIWDHFKGPKFKGHKSRKMTAFKLKQTYYPSHPAMVAYRQALETFGEFKFNLLWLRLVTKSFLSCGTMMACLLLWDLLR